MQDFVCSLRKRAQRWEKGHGARRKGHGTVPCWNTILVNECHLDVSPVTILINILYELRERRSCETQLIMLVDELSKNMQMGKQTDLMLLDFSKAFDKVAHEKLPSKTSFLRYSGGYTKMD